MATKHSKFENPKLETSDWHWDKDLKCWVQASRETKSPPPKDLYNSMSTSKSTQKAFKQVPKGATSARSIAIGDFLAAAKSDSQEPREPVSESPAAHEPGFAESINLFNELMKKAQEKPDEKMRLLSEAATHADKTLERLVKSEGYGELVRKLEGGQARTDFEMVTSDPVQLGKFTSALLELEHLSGQEPEAVMGLWDASSPVIKGIRDGKLRPAAARDAIADLQRETAKVASDLEGQAADEARAAWAKKASKVFLKLSSLVATAAVGPAIAPVFSALEPPFDGAASWIVGGAIDGLFNAQEEKKSMR